MRAPCRAATAQRPLLSAPTRPKLEAERTDFGLRNYAIREAGDGRRYVRINNFIMPNKVAAVGNEGRVSEGYTIHWRVPVDDESHIRFDVYVNRVRPVARQQLLAAIESVQSGRDPIHVIRDAAENDMSHIVVLSEVVAPGDDPKELWKSRRQLPAAASGATRACRRSRVG